MKKNQGNKKVIHPGGNNRRPSIRFCKKCQVFHLTGKLYRNRHREEKDEATAGKSE